MVKQPSSYFLFATFAASAWLALDGCRFTEVNAKHCNANEGDAYCAEQYPDGSFPYCETGMGACITSTTLGCVAELPADRCYAPCGGAATIEEDDSCLGGGSSDGSGSSGPSGASTDSGSESSEGSSESTGPVPCMDSDECTDADAPFCDPQLGVCVACDELGDGNGDGACEERDAMAPLCVSGSCVACTVEDTSVCDAQLLVCGDGNACGPCVAHDECGSGVCDIAAGTCFDSANVLDVGLGQAYATINVALDDVAAMGLGSAVLRLHDGPSFDEVATVTSGAVAFVAAEGQTPRWINSAVAQPTLTVSGGETRVYIVELRMSLNATDTAVLVEGGTVDVRDSQLVDNNGGGIVAEGGTVDVRDSQLVDNNGGGIVAEGGMVDLRRSQIVENDGGGIVSNNGAQLYVENCFVGGDFNDVDALAVNGGTATLNYVTVAAGFGDAAALRCSGDATVSARNSLFVARAAAPEIVCSAGTIETSAAELAIGSDNTALGDMDTGWFQDFGGGDFHLDAAPASITSAATWSIGDPLVDIDGEARPGTEGASDAAGADVP